MAGGRRLRRGPALRAAALAASLAASLAAGCGAGDADAPLLPARPACPTLDEAAARWLDDVGAGAYGGTATMLRTTLPMPAVRVLVGAALRALAPLGVDVPGQLIALLHASDGGPWPRLFAAVESAVQAPTAGAAALALRTAASSCTDPTHLTTLATLIDDPRARSGLAALLGGEPDALAKALGGLGVTTPKGAQTLLGLLLDSAARPDFDPDALRLTLADAKPAAGTAAATLDALIAVLDGATRDFDGKLDPARIAASSALIACVRDADPDDALLALLTGVLWPPSDVAGLPAAPTTTAGDGSARGARPTAGGDAGHIGALFDAVAALLRLLAVEPETVQAVRAIVDAVATADTLRAVAPELRHLASSGALPALGDALDLALHASCTERP